MAAGGSAALATDEETTESGGTLKGVVLPSVRRPALEALLGRALPTEVWSEQLTGHRILVVPEPVSERTGGGLLFKPRTAQEREALEMGAGWIIGAGPLAGQLDGQAHPVGILAAAPSLLLGLRVLFKQYSGVNLKTSEDDDEFGGKFALIVLTDRDVLTWRDGV